MKEKLGSNVVKKAGVMWWKEGKWCDGRGEGVMWWKERKWCDGRDGSNVVEEEEVML